MSKRQRGSTSRSAATPPFDYTKFVTPEAERRYHTVLFSKQLILERGLIPDPVLDGKMAEQIATRNWENVTAPPVPAVISIVKEFYANAIQATQCVVQVRGKSVHYSREAINAYYQVEPIEEEDDYLFDGIERYDLDNVVRVLCKSGTTWRLKMGSSEKHSFNHSTLSRYGKAWYSFICANFMPTSHQSNVSKERAVLLYAIVTDMDIDIGVLLQDQIQKYLDGKAKANLPFPSLITGLCKAAGVLWNADEAIQQPMAAIDHSNIERYIIWPHGVSHPEGKGFTQLDDEQGIDEQNPQQQHPQNQVVLEPSLASLQAAIERIAQKMDRHSRRQNRRIDAVGQRVESLLQFNVDLARTISRIHSGGASSSSEPVKFPDPPEPVDYNVDSPDEEEDED